MICIDAPHFAVGLVLKGGRVERAAPIVRYMVGWSAATVLGYCRARGWQATYH